MRRTVLFLGCLAALVLAASAYAQKAPPQPPILPPAEEVPAQTPEPTSLPPSSSRTAINPTPILGTIHFDFDQSAIRSGDAEILKGNAGYLHDSPDVKVMLEGFCDPIGTPEYNRGLGLRRAVAVRQYLAKLGVDAKRLSVTSFGEEQTVTTNPAEFERNRRVECKEQ